MNDDDEVELTERGLIDGELDSSDCSSSSKVVLIIVQKLSTRVVEKMQ